MAGKAQAQSHHLLFAIAAERRLLARQVNNACHLQDALLLAEATLQLAFLAAAVFEDRHLRGAANERLAEATRQPSLACLLDDEQILAEGEFLLVSQNKIATWQRRRHLTEGMSIARPVSSSVLTQLVTL